MKLTKVQLKQMIREEIQKVLEAKKPQNPKFAGGVRVKHKEHGEGTVTAPGAAPEPGEQRHVSVRWDDKTVDKLYTRVIESSLTKI